jgi:hypothetical protein
MAFVVMEQRRELHSMSALPRVTELTRERVAREFDDVGPDACIADIVQHLRSYNPEILDMASRSASDLGEPAKIMVGFGMFYRLLIAQSPLGAGTSRLSPLPRVTPETRDAIVRQIDEKGTEAFTLETIDEMEQENPELIQMAYGFASRYPDTLGVMQGFALLYRSLADQSTVDRARLH